MLLWSAAVLAAPVDMADMEMELVYAWGDTGYYVDIKSPDFKNDHEVTDQILDSVMAVYATKERVSGNARPTAVTPYAAGSPMEAVVEYIFSPQP